MSGGAELQAAVRAMTRRDVASVAALAAGEATAPHWPLHEYERMLDVIAELPGRRGAWVLCLPGHVPGPDLRTLPGPVRKTVAEGEQRTPPEPVQLAGFAMATHVAGVCELEAVVVQAALRGQRLGEALVQAVVGWGVALGATRLHLEVRPSNAAAISLYARMGFKVDGLRRGYYRSPVEDAVLMGVALLPGSGGSAL